jgi:hypothetical protein
MHCLITIEMVLNIAYAVGCIGLHVSYSVTKLRLHC